MMTLDAGRARRLAWLALALYLAALLISSVLRVQGDFNVYYLTGQRVLKGAPLYPLTDKNHFLYAPIFALFFAPFALLPRHAAQGVWFLVCGGALLLMIFGAARILFGRGQKLSAALIVIPVLLTARFINDNFQHGQINLPALALVIWAIALGEESPPAAGAALAAAILIKPFALLGALYLALRVRYSALIFTIIAGLILLAVPVLFLGPERAGAETLAYAAAVHSMAGRYRLMLTNQSMSSAIARLLAGSSGGQASPSVAGLLGLFAGTAIELALIAAVSLWTLIRRPRAGAAPDWRFPLAAMFCLMPSFAPVSWKSYYAALLLPYMMLTAALGSERRAGVSKSRLSWALVILSVILNVLPGRHLNRLALFYSAHLVSSLLVLGALLAAAPGRVPSAEPARAPSAVAAR